MADMFEYIQNFQSYSISWIGSFSSLLFYLINLAFVFQLAIQTDYICNFSKGSVAHPGVVQKPSATLKLEW